MNRRLLAILIVFCLILSCLPMPAKAATVKVTLCTLTEENPLYCGGEAETETIEVTVSDAPVRLLALNSEYGTEAEATDVIRQALVARQSSVTVLIFSADSDYSTIARSAFYAAMEHTGDPVEGDYLLWHYGGYSCSIRYRESNGVYYYELTYTVSYYTTAEQEAELTTAVSELLSDLDLDGKSEYQKFSAIYDYICANITYDYEHLGDEDYKLQYSAYAALINKTAVCQGYANLLYRLLLTVGVDCRFIAGDGSGPHGWNIVKIGDYYYNVDATWDAGSSPQYYNYCLVTDANFGNHTRDAEYATDEFYTAYPMASSDYLNSGHLMTAYPATEKTCTTAGNSAYWYCSHCDKYFSDANGACEIQENSWVISAGHTWDGTYAYDSSRHWQTCAKCETTTTAQQHTMSGWYEETNATCEDSGLEKNKCTVCDFCQENVLPKTAHTMVELEAADATCTENGNSEYYECLTCHKYYSDANGDQEVQTGSWIIPADGHSMQHTLYKAATCLEPGNIEYWYCSGCNKRFTDPDGTSEVSESDCCIMAHSTTIFTYQAPTESEAGHIEYIYCSECHKYYIIAEDQYVEVTEEDVLIPATGPQIILGDADGDGLLTLTDASAIKAYRSGLTDGSALDPEAADLDGNGNVDVYDAYLIQLYMAEKITKFPVEG